MSVILTYNNRPLEFGHYTFIEYAYDYDWVPMTWKYGRIPTYGDNVWKRSDTGSIYYSQRTGGTTKNYFLGYVPSGGTTGDWGNAYWSGMGGGGETIFDGRHVWNGVDGKTYYSYSYVYPSYEAGNYVLMTPSGSNAYWSRKYWGSTTLVGENIWSIGGVNYYDTNYYYNQTDDKWYVATWQRDTPMYTSNPSGYHIWTDTSGNVYYSYVPEGHDTEQYEIRSSGTGQHPAGTFYAKIWYGLTSFYGEDVWRDVKTGMTFYSNGTTQYTLDESTSTWTPWTWKGLTDFYGRYVWTDGNRMFYSNGDSNQYVLNW